MRNHKRYLAELTKWSIVSVVFGVLTHTTYSRWNRLFRKLFPSTPSQALNLSDIIEKEKIGLSTPQVHEFAKILDHIKQTKRPTTEQLGYIYTALSNLIDDIRIQSGQESAVLYTLRLSLGVQLGAKEHRSNDVMRIKFLTKTGYPIELRNRLRRTLDEIGIDIEY
jgi:hypothetical protein